jgi:pimeloyl-ACP methyl ester carboxylesterase
MHSQIRRWFPAVCVMVGLLDLALLSSGITTRAGEAATRLLQAAENNSYLPLVMSSNVAASTPGPTSAPLPPGEGKSFRTSVAPSGEEVFGSAEFSLWIPDGASTIHGVIIYAPGCGGASSLTDKPSSDRAALARKWSFGFLGMKFTDNGSKLCGWSRPGQGSARALQQALQNFSKDSGHKELISAPWLLFGYSGGSSWSLGMAELFPDRTIAVFSRGFGPKTITPQMRSIPILLNGKKDGSYGTIASFGTCRTQGGLCGLNVDPGGEPSLGNQWSSMGLPFFDAALKQRLPASGTQLLPPDAARTWIGNQSDFTIAPEGSFSGDKTQASWLIDEAMAQRWKEYNASGKLTPWTP